jgi:hypothetical protein
MGLARDLYLLNYRSCDYDLSRSDPPGSKPLLIIKERSVRPSSSSLRTDMAAL